MDLTIKKGGFLSATGWNTKTGQNVTKDVTTSLHRVLMWPCLIDEDVTLLDVFLLASKLRKSVQPSISTWFKEFVAEALEPPKERSSEMQYLELYRDVFIEKEDEVGLKFFPGFHGIGSDEKGNTTPFGVWLSPVYTYAYLPLKLNTDVKVYKGNELAITIPNVGFSLMDILSGIFWEISFSGPPKKRDKFSKKLSKED